MNLRIGLTGSSCTGKTTLANNMIVPGSSYWNVGIGLFPGDVDKDEEGVETMRNLGKNIAWLLKKLHT